PANSGEVYFRGGLKWGLFVKGFAGAGAISGGTLIDEDFPPATVPYSRTTSDASGSLNYGTLDVGYSPFRYPAGRLGFFAGYGRWHESINAAGCTQVGGNPEICAPPLAPSITVVNEADTWNLLRLGATADAMLGEHFKLTADAAYVRAFQNAVDNHFFTL